jgi:hypothetical protein
MEVNVEVKIKIGKEKQIVLKNEDAKELYLKLKELYEQKTEYVPYPYYPTTYPTTYPSPWVWKEPYYIYNPITCSDNTSFSIKCDDTSF